MSAMAKRMNQLPASSEAKNKQTLLPDVHHPLEVHRCCCQHHVDVGSLDSFVIVSAQTVITF
jgi:hypothetical protein